MCADMCTDMCTNMRADMCADMCCRHVHRRVYRMPNISRPACPSMSRSPAAPVEQSVTYSPKAPIVRYLQPQGTYSPLPIVRYLQSVTYSPKAPTVPRHLQSVTDRTSGGYSNGAEF